MNRAGLVCGHFIKGEIVQLDSPYGYIRAERCNVANGQMGQVAGERGGKVWVEFGLYDEAAVPIHWLRPVDRP